MNGLRLRTRHCIEGKERKNILEAGNLDRAASWYDDEHEEQIRLLTKAMDYTPNDHALYVNRGIAYMNMGNEMADLLLRK